ncbi:MAG: adenosylhomocysteinase [Clostridia bacterium]|nr:adenosylhomocysteinase [Clostridia bacterium]MDD4145747.1 adenosylhomocysteinase [Clostridia bacterium]MDD4665844.1 adenosylhomocysteinase [Clostridia bacterium]
MSRESCLRDLSLAPKGEAKISWVRNYMPVLNQIRTEFCKEKPFNGKKIAMCLHLEAKTGYLALVLQAGGAEVTVVASNPLSTQDDVVAALVRQGISAFAWYGATREEYEQHHRQALELKPDLLIDDGGDLLTLLHTEYTQLLPKIIGGCEETTTGIIRLQAMERAGMLKIPVVSVNDALMKHLFDNRYGTGQSVWDGINGTTNLLVAGKNVVVAGYGWCGRGVAMRAKGLGAKVIVTEVNPVRANEALLDGFAVMPMFKAAALGNVFVTTTGNKNVLRQEHFNLMPDGAILANAGHFDVEINKFDLKKVSVASKIIKPNIEEFVLSDGRKLFLLAEGRLVNLASGNGHPAEIMDLSFSLQALSLAYLVHNSGKLPMGVISVPQEIDYRVASLRLEALGYEIDLLTEEQEKYLEAW